MGHILEAYSYATSQQSTALNSACTYHEKNNLDLYIKGRKGE